MRLSHSTSITLHSIYILVDIQPATVERLRLRSSAVYILYTICFMDQDDVLHAIYMFHNFHLIRFWFLTTRGATTAEKLKFWNWFSPWHACCLLGYTRRREPTNERKATRTQDLASEFSKKNSGVTPPDPHSGRGRPVPAPTPSQASGLARRASASVLGPKPWSPSTFQPW